MGYINRDGDVSEQKEFVNWSSSYGQSGLGVDTGTTYVIAGPLPYAFVVQSVQAVALGASGAPQLALALNRVVSKTGITTIALGISNYVIPNSSSFQIAVGWSGLRATGNTLLIGQMGDVLVASTAGANTACSQLLIQVVLKKTQDIVSHNGIAT